MLGEDKGFVGPVRVAVTTIRLVREAEIQLRRLCLQQVTGSIPSLLYFEFVFVKSLLICLICLTSLLDYYR